MNTNEILTPQVATEYYIDNISEFDGSGDELDFTQQEIIDLITGKAKLLYTSYFVGGVDMVIDGEECLVAEEGGEGTETWLRNNQTGLEMNLTTGESREEYDARINAECEEDCGED